ncbi:MAG: 2-oxoglutarate dehydrogenase E1 component [Vicinamibacterales bacterium]
MNPWDQFTGANAGYVQELYERYQQDPGSVDEATRQAFAGWAPPPVEHAMPPASSAGGTVDDERLHVGIETFRLAQSLRRFGHLAARLDPLGFADPVGDPSLELQTHGLTPDRLRALPASIVGGPASQGAANALEAIENLRRVYCQGTGHDYNQVFVPEQRAFLWQAVESCRFRPPTDPILGRDLLERITRVETFERFLHRTFPGKTRFSIEGLDMMIPILDEIISDAAAGGVHHVMIAMAHRGRLNVLAHILQKPYAQILAEFKDPMFSRSWRVDLGWMGDVKYHAGARVERRGDLPDSLVISMPPNPSHLEAVDPVLNGMARAAATFTDQPGAPRFKTSEVLAILIHGDSAFPGQGVVAETLNLSRLDGYDVGGIIHVIANNQLGFTAEPEESFSTSYASGLARGFKIPITHVNADDVVGCIEAARLAWAFRERFAIDFIIDLVGYRRHGHNEGDEPAFTQPQIYQVVAGHPTVRELYARHLAESGEVSAEDADAMVQAQMATLERAYAGLKPETDFVPPEVPQPPRGAARRANTAVPLDRLRMLNDELLATPEDFTVHRKLERGRERRKTMLDTPGERTVDWAAAEELAMASILADGVPIRLTGEDVERGTFSHRHAVYHDAVTGTEYVPLQSIPSAKAAFEIHNSPLTENATVGFELGYNLQEPNRLVMWEAQYGDFINGAQVVLDEFLTSGRAKWGLTPSLVLLLPHGYEGQGPDHSSARLERFLNAAADTNIRIVNCTSAAQYFHVLRRQASLLVTDPLPLVVMTPRACPPSQHRVGGGRDGRGPLPARHRRRDDPAADEGEAPGALQREGLRGPGLVRGAQGQPGRRAGTRGAALSVPGGRDPGPPRPLSQAARRLLGPGGAENMGAWEFARPLLEQLIDGRWPLRYIGRARNSSRPRALHVARRQPEGDRRTGLRPEDRLEGTRSRIVKTGIDARTCQTSWCPNWASRSSRLAWRSG